MPSNHFKDLPAWQAAMELVKEIYIASGSFPEDESLGLRADIRRAAVAVPGNIAQAQGCRGTPAAAHHLALAYGCLLELETFMLIAVQLGYLEVPDTSPCQQLIDRVRRHLDGA